MRGRRHVNRMDLGKVPELKNITKDIKKKIIDNNIMSYDKQLGWLLWEDQRKYDKKYGNRADGEPKVVAKAGKGEGREGTYGGGYIREKNVIGGSGKYKFEGLSGLVVSTQYNYYQEYTWEQMWEILKKRGLAKNTIATYKRNLEKIRNVRNPETGEFILPIIRTWSPQEFALAILYRIWYGWDRNPEYYQKPTSRIRSSVYNPLLEALLFGMRKDWSLPTPEMVELSKEYPYSASKEKAIIAALLVALNANKEDFILKAGTGTREIWKSHSLIPFLKSRAVALQKAYHQKVEGKKTAKEDKNWVEWTEIVGKAKETIKTFWDLVESKGLPKITAKLYAAAYKKYKKEHKLKTAADMAGFLHDFFYPYENIMNKPFTTKILNAIVAALYTDLPPRRLDWTKLVYTDEKGFKEMCGDNHKKKIVPEGELKQSEIDCDDDEFAEAVHDRIWWVVPNYANPFSSKTYLVFGRNAGKSPQPEELRVDNIPSQLRILVGTYWNLLTSKEPEWEGFVYDSAPLLVNAMSQFGGGDTGKEFDGFLEITENGLGKRIKKIFSGMYDKKKKNITASQLRKIFISHMFKGDAEKKAQIARLMNHSVKIQQHIYNKEGNILPEDFMKLESNSVAATKNKKAQPKSSGGGAGETKSGK